MRKLISTFFALLVVSAALLAGLGAYTHFSTSRLAGRTAKVLRENYDSMAYMDEAMLAVADEERRLLKALAPSVVAASDNLTSAHVTRTAPDFRLRIDEALRKEERNLTLPGETEAAGRLRAAAEAYYDQRELAQVGGDAAATDASTSAAIGLLPMLDGVRREAASIRKMNHDWMESAAQRQLALAPRFIFGATLASVAILIAVGLYLAKRLLRQAREYHALRTHFVAMASHELRTPVTSLRMGLDLLHAESVGLLNEEQKAVTKAGLEDCDRLMTLSRQLLDVTKIQSGQLEMRKTAVRLSALVADAVSALRSQIQEKKVTVDLDLQSAQHIEVEADPIKATWVITNLLANSLRYSADGAVIRISAADGNHDVRLSVSDAGPGIPPEIAPHVFQPYYQAPDAASAKRGSAGLGLAIAHEIVAAHGGRIWVEPRPFLGKGTTITFTLPKAPEV